MAGVVLDTDAASRLYRGRADPEMTRVLAGSAFAITFVTVGELYLWADVRSWGSARRDQLEVWINRVPVLNSDAAVASV